MAIELKMPALSPTMEEGTLAKWLVKEGDQVKSGDILAEIETDKATMEFEAIDEGRIANILVPEGTENVAVGTVIATILEEGESAVPAPKHEPEVTAKAEAPAVDQRVKESEAPAAGAKPAAPEPHLVETGARQLFQAASHDAASDPEIPAGTELVKMTVREALRDAMAEEMRVD